MPSRLWIALPVTLLAAACTTTDTDQVRGVAVARQRMVVTGSTTTTSGFCGEGDTSIGAVLFVSADGRRFDRVLPPGDRPIDAIVTHDGTFFMLRSGDDGFAVEASPDGVTWTERVAGADAAHDLIVDAGGLQVAHRGGVLSSVDGVTWIDHPVDGAGLYAPHLARVGDRFVLATGDGALSTSTDAATWAPRAIGTLTSVHRLASAGGRAVAIAHADRDGYDRNYLVAFDPATDAPATFAPIADGVMAIVDAPAGLLVGDGTLATGDALGSRAAHTDAFWAGAVDGDTVVLARDDTITLSTDGGATFGAPVALPLAR